MVCLNEVSEASFLDGFGLPNYDRYTYSNSYGSGGSYVISAGKLKITTGNDNTASVMTTDPVVFPVGEILSLDVPPISANQSAFMMCSTIAGQPNGGTSFGFRFRRDGGTLVRMQLCPGDILPSTNDPSPGKPATLMVKRTSETDFEYSIRIEGGVTQLGSFTLSQLSGNIDLHIGAQAYALSGGTTFAFDNLRVSNALISTELTVLTYNTHLFENSPLECIVRCGGLAFWLEDPPDWADYALEDGERRDTIAAYVRSSGADIVALQEVWSIGYRQWLQSTLGDTYPYSYHLDSSCYCRNALNGIESTLDTCITLIAGLPTLYLPWSGPDYDNRFHTEGNGLVLLSKWPLQDIQFTKFPAFNCYLKNPATECWADKGVLTATVNVNGAPIRIGISHALTGPDDHKSNWDTDYFATASACFQLDGEPYIFGLDSYSNGHILRMEDYGRWWDEKNQKYNHGAGWKHIHERYWGADYVDVTPFELDGHPYLFSVNDSKKGRITKINDDPSTGWTHLHTGDWGSHCVAVASFEQGGRPYLFSVDDSNSAHITRINENPSTGWSDTATDTWSSEYASIASFELDGHPYIFAHNSDQGRIIRINDDPNAGWSTVDEGGAMSFVGYVTCTSFELDGHPYLFGLNANNNAYILRINNDPCTGWTYTYKGPDDENLTAWYRFEGDSNDSSGNNHHPYEFGAPTYSADSREGGLSIELDGVDDFLVKESIGISGSSPRTISGWVKATKPAAQIPGWRNVFGFSYEQIDDTHFDIQRRNEQDNYCIHTFGWDNKIAPLDMEWHHLAATYNGNTIAWYHDGGLVGTMGRVLNTFGTMIFGRRVDDYTTFFPGRLDDVRIYNRALSQGEIAELAGWGDIAVFEMYGHPYLFALRNCCGQNMGPCEQPLPREAHLKRINDDPNTGWEDLLQLEDIRIIRDKTVVDEDGPPAIMMGDFNIHRGKYGIMDELFGKAGAVDAYAQVADAAQDGNTVDWSSNELCQYFWSDVNPTDPDLVDRIDYVYVRQSGAGMRLVPTEAHVIRNWTYDSSELGVCNLSDHYPLFVTFRLEIGCAAMKADFNCDRLVDISDLAILCSAWLSEPNAAAWNLACDISEPPDEFVDFNDYSEFARQWQTMPIHNITRDKWYEVIQAAINDANDGEEIEAAPGYYYETIDFKGKAITLRSTEPNDPSVIAATVINGFGHYHVVKCVTGEDANTVLAGFTITGGNANGSDADSVGGGGMYNSGSSPTVTNCMFRNNSAVYGGGMFNNNASHPMVTNCTFSNNTTSIYGGGMFNLNSSSPTVTDCTFSSNTVEAYGGGMSNYNSSPTVTNCTFTSNTAAMYGAGMFNYENSSPTVTNCNFTSNAADEGGGMGNKDGSSPTITNCSFTSNAADEGGGMENKDGSSPTITNCSFTSNTASNYGGGIYNDHSLPTVTNCIFNQNIAQQRLGGGIANYNSSHSTVTNCTFSGNVAGGGAGIRNWDSSPIVKNCILWDNEPDEIASGGTSVPTVQYCDVQGGYSGTGNINADPCFVDAIGGDLQLSTPNSPCVDAGNNNAIPADTPDLDGDGNTVEPIPFDLAGNSRVMDGDGDLTATVDMGAYEFALAYFGDFDNNCSVNFFDFSILARAWMTQEGDPDWD